jgi:hypothetical protein
MGPILDGQNIKGEWKPEQHKLTTKGPNPKPSTKTEILRIDTVGVTWNSCWMPISENEA